MVSQFAIDCGLTRVEDWWQWSLLHHAAHLGDVESLSALITADPELVNQVDSQGKTALHRAAQWGRVACVRELLERGAAPCVRNNFQMTALQDAVRAPTSALLLLLLLLLLRAGLRTPWFAAQGGRRPRGGRADAAPE